MGEDGCPSISLPLPLSQDQFFLSLARGGVGLTHLSRLPRQRERVVDELALADHRVHRDVRVAAHPERRGSHAEVMAS